MLENYADLSIRRAIGFTGLAIGTVMLGLSFDVVLAFRTGGEMCALLLIGLVLAGWRAPRRDIRHTEVYALLRDAGLPRARLAQQETQAELGAVLRSRLLWHAERVGLVALALWGGALVVWAVR